HRVVHAIVFLALLLNGYSHSIAQDKPKIPRAIDRDREAVEDPAEIDDKQGGDRLIEMDRGRWIDMVYGQLGGNEATFDQNYRRRVRLALNRIDLICGISDTLREKVQATAELESQRLKADILTLINDAPTRLTQKQYSDFYQRIWKLIQPYQSRMNQGNNQDGEALWRKVLTSQLDDKQQQKITEDAAKRTAYREDVQRLETVLKITRRLGLSRDQRTNLDKQSQTHPNNWQNLDMAWNTLQALPDAEKRSWFTPFQLEQLKKPLETTNDLQVVIMVEE
ncbi:MAG: hypothetical protein ACK52S_08100, partial [Pirellula sp.]